MDKEVFKAVIIPHKDKMFRFARRILLDDDDAMDIVQEAFLRIWINKNKLEDVENKEAWCMRVTKNLALDKLKSGHTRHLSQMSEHHIAIASGNADPSRTTEMKDTISSITKILGTLPETQRHVVHLRDIEGYSYKEIAEILNVDMSNVKICLFRARRAIREKLYKIEHHGL